MQSTDTAFVIGDIHGCLDKLTHLVADIPSNMQIYSVGDLIDRGKDSRAVINFVRDNNIQVVKGNHELMAIECLPNLRSHVNENSNTSMYTLYESDWFYNGGHDVFNQYKATNDLPQLITDIEYLDSLPLYIETGIKDENGLELLISHTWTSYRNFDRANNQFDFVFVWNRDQPIGISNKSKYYNTFGHTPVDYVLQHVYHKKNTPEVSPEPIFSDGACNLDTGAPYDSRGRGVLSGVFFPSLDVKQVKD